MSDNIVKKVCKELGITQKELKKEGSKLTLKHYLKFENSKTLEEAYKHLSTTYILLKAAEESRLFPIPLHERQNKTKIKIHYPNIRVDIECGLYAIKMLPQLSNMLEQPIKQAELKKKLNPDECDIDKLLSGFYFLSQYGLIKRWNSKNRVWLQYNQEEIENPNKTKEGTIWEKIKILLKRFARN